MLSAAVSFASFNALMGMDSAKALAAMNWLLCIKCTNSADKVC